jgi:hypothetical protein
LTVSATTTAVRVSTRFALGESVILGARGHATDWVTVQAASGARRT